MRYHTAPPSYSGTRTALAAMPDGTDTGERAVAAARAALMKAGTNTSSFGPGINGGSGNSTASDEAPATGGKARRTKVRMKGAGARY